MAKNSTSNPKEIMISVRIGQEKADIIEKSAERLSISRSELIRRAASSYIALWVENIEHPNPKLFFSHNMMKILFDNATDETIKAVAHQSFLNGRFDYQFFKELTGEKPLPHEKEISELDPIKSLVTNVFSADGQKWFEKVRFTQKNNRVQIDGRHDLGSKFSLFVKYLLIEYFTPIGYKLIHDNMTSTELVESKNAKTFIVKFVFEHITDKDKAVKKPKNSKK